MNINFRSQRLLQGYDFLQSTSDSKPIKVLVHEFIQSVIFTPFPQDSELQVERLTLAGNIYESIGFKKKAALYKRFAALKSATAQSNWQDCYNSLLDTLDGFGLNLDPVAYERALEDKSSFVWPGMHIQLIEELVTCCKRMQNSQAGTLAIRHISFMLHTLDFYLPVSKKREFAKELEEASSTFGEDSPVPLKLANGHVIPTVNLTKHPLCLKLEPIPHPMALRPVRLLHIRRRSLLLPEGDEKDDNPFIFTPIVSHNSLTNLESRRTTSNSYITDIVWAQDEPCTTLLVLKNNLPFELRISSIKLLTDGVPLETKPHSLTLGAEQADPEVISLIGIPRQLPRTTDDSQLITNKLDIFGYSTHLLGVKSNCRLDMIPKSKFPNQYVVEVCPPLPRIEFQFADESSYEALVDPIPADKVDKDLVVMEYKAEGDINETLAITMTILNSSNVDVEYMYVQEKRPRNVQASSVGLISWQDELLDNLKTNPLKARQKLDLPVRLELKSELFKSTNTFSSNLTFEYSGGLALKEMYCRKCVIKFSVSLKPKTTPESSEQNESEHMDRTQ